MKLYDDVLSAEQCERLIEIFETSVESESFDDDTKKLDQVTLDMENDPIAKEIADITISLFESYVVHCKMLPCQIPTNFGVEGIRIKKYYDDTCTFLPHVDALDHASAKRYISFLFYLNTIDDGTGRTVFMNGEEGIAIRPKQGSCLMFPPLWTMPHYAEPSYSNKYIMSTYINFL